MTKSQRLCYSSSGLLSLLVSLILIAFQTEVALASSINLKQQDRNGRFTYGNSTYEISAQKFDWYNAKIECELKGMKLVSIESEEENDAILGEISVYSESFWISGTDQGMENYFYWDSTGYSYGPYQNWALGEPNNANETAENCIILWHLSGFEWNDYPCNGDLLRFICEEKTSLITGTQKDISDARRRFTYDDGIYEVSALALDWWKAKYDCKARGMNLVTIETEDENQAIFQNLRSFASISNFWTSGTDLGKEYNYYWDSTGVFFGPFTNWSSGEPSNGEVEHCVAFVTETGLWIDDPCAFNRRYLCEYRPPQSKDRHEMKVVPREITLTHESYTGGVSFYFEKNYYEISSQKFDWYTAKLECSLLGMDLVSIESADENNAILEAIGAYNESFWISGVDQLSKLVYNSENYFYWDSTGHILGPYVNWGEGQPNIQNVTDKECLIMYFLDNYAWHDVGCSGDLFRFICERKISPVNEKTESYSISPAPTGLAMKDKMDFIFQDSVYKISSDVMDWYRAKYDCESRGMELVSIESAEENAAITYNLILIQDDSFELPACLVIIRNSKNSFFAGIFGSYFPHFWISGTDLGRESDFYWDSTGQSFGPFFNWNDTQPDDGNNGADDCVLLYMPSGNWLDEPCVRQYRYLCESKI